MTYFFNWHSILSRKRLRIIVIMCYTLAHSSRLRGMLLLMLIENTWCIYTSEYVSNIFLFCFQIIDLASYLRPLNIYATVEPAGLRTIKETEERYRV